MLLMCLWERLQHNTQDPESSTNWALMLSVLRRACNLVLYKILLLRGQSTTQTMQQCYKALKSSVPVYRIIDISQSPSPHQLTRCLQRFCAQSAVHAQACTDCHHLHLDAFWVHALPLQQHEQCLESYSSACCCLNARAACATDKMQDWVWHDNSIH